MIPIFNNIDPNKENINTKFSCTSTFKDLSIEDNTGMTNITASTDASTNRIDSSKNITAQVLNTQEISTTTNNITSTKDKSVPEKITTAASLLDFLKYSTPRIQKKIGQNSDKSQGSSSPPPLELAWSPCISSRPYSLTISRNDDPAESLEKLVAFFILENRARKVSWSFFWIS